MDNPSAPSSNVQERRIEVIGQMVSFVRVEDQVRMQQQQQPLFPTPQYGLYPSASTSSANLSSYSQNIRMPSHSGSTHYMQPFLRGPSPTVARMSAPYNPQPIYYPNQRIISNSLMEQQYSLPYQQPSASIQTHDLNQQLVHVPTNNQSRQKQANNDGPYLRDSATVTANKTAADSQVKFASSTKTSNSTQVSHKGNTMQMSQSSFQNMDSMAKRHLLLHNQLSSQAINLKSTSIQDGTSVAMFIKKEEESEVKYSINLTKPTKTKLAQNTVGEEAVQPKKVKHEDDLSDSDYNSTDSKIEPGR